MKAYEYTVEELKIIAELLGLELSPEETWSHDSIKDIKKRVKQHYIDEQGQKCAYCKVDLHSSHGLIWDTEHIIDKDSYPEWIFEPHNLCTSCKDCNQHKYQKPITKSSTYKKFPKKSKNYKIIHAHFDDYDEHIEVAVPGNTYRWKTMKGKSTMEVCSLNRYHEVADRSNIDHTLRAVLCYAGEHQTEEAEKAALEYLLKRKKARDSNH
ncbi:hypothetical protein [Pseudoalteromonas sp. HF66]|uniref:hypothetical protein n=1 Tax=Pseudoalteromonas sp. HF66 TaxID=2721559 RepID=UPI0014312416|nr:hypothetical protein [Pseudoalteromonas sp. HF66]NIZ06472.1 hypothetical protein [Pseudoalteromonas sp. HF66]